MKLFYCLLLIGYCKNSFCQTDTTFIFVAKDGHQTTKDSAYNCVKMYRLNNAWHGKDFYMKTGVLKSEGDYADNSIKTPVGSFNNYSEDGKLLIVASYTDGKPDEATYYYKSGKKKSWASFNEKQEVKDQKGWDESGAEIKNYIVMKPARFKGGSEGWQKYLSKKLNRTVIDDPNVPAGEVRVLLSFKVSEEGVISNVKVVSSTPRCRQCETEAMQVLIGSPDWEPAIQQNVPIPYFIMQPITFLIPEDKKKKP